MENKTIYCGDPVFCCGFKNVEGSMSKCLFSGYCDFQRPKRPTAFYTIQSPEYISSSIKKGENK